MGMTIPDSERLSYRPLTAADEALLFALDQDPAVMQYINGGKPSSPEEIRDTFIPRLERYADTEKGWGLWGVFLPGQPEHDGFIGWILIRPMHFFSDSPDWHDLEIGWRFKQQSWGKGYATEAARAVVEVVTALASVTHLSAIALPENTGSIGIMKKLGMHYSKTDLHRDPTGDMTVAYYTMTVADNG